MWTCPDLLVVASEFTMDALGLAVRRAALFRDRLGVYHPGSSRSGAHKYPVVIKLGGHRTIENDHLSAVKPRLQASRVLPSRVACIVLSATEW